MSFSFKNFISLLNVAIQNQARDIHLRQDEEPCLRIKNELVPIQTRPLTEEDMQDVIKILLTKEKAQELFQKFELDGSIGIEGLCRVRYNIYRSMGHFSVILRIIKFNIPTLKELNLSSVIESIALAKKGLIIITGVTGSGKSTTLAGMLDFINHHQNSHIITIEDPIEYVYQSKKSRFSQREVGTDTSDFASGLRAALRQDPDVIAIGEIRDTETISTALKAAETGHIVFSTMHTTDSMTTIGRILSMFPANEQEEVRKRLAYNLHATIGQRMLLGKMGQSIVAQEIMISTAGIRDCILGKDDLSRIPGLISQGMGKAINGGQTFDQHIMQLLEKGIISKDVAFEAASSQSDFTQKLFVD